MTDQKTLDEIMVRAQAMFKKKEMNDFFRDRLLTYIPNTKVVLLCDDSSSMTQTILSEGADPFAPITAATKTRWSELKRLAAEIITIVTSLNNNGIDLHFLHREKLTGVTTPAGLQAKFLELPHEETTPLVATLEKVYNENVPFLNKGQKLLIICICDGEPRGSPVETREGLKASLLNITRSGQVHVAFSEATDSEEDCEYLDSFDGIIPNFDNNDFCEMEIARVKRIQGVNFKFDYSDYVAKILLGTFDRWCYLLDQSKISDVRGANMLVSFPAPSAPPSYSAAVATTSVLPPTSQFSPPAMSAAQATSVYYGAPSVATIPKQPQACCVVS